MARAGLVVLVALLLPSTAVLAGEGKTKKKKKKYVIEGVVQLKGGPPLSQAVYNSATAPGSPCFGWSGSIRAATGGTADIVRGVSILVRNENNDKVLAKTTLGAGAIANFVPLAGGGSNFDCNFPFKTKKAPKADFYSIELGQREGAVFSFDELKENDWQVVITVPDAV